MAELFERIVYVQRLISEDINFNQKLGFHPLRIHSTVTAFLEVTGSCTFDINGEHFVVTSISSILLVMISFYLN